MSMPPVQLSVEQRAAGRLSGWVACPLCGRRVELILGRFFPRIETHYASTLQMCRASGSDVAL